MEILYLKIYPPNFLYNKNGIYLKRAEHFANILHFSIPKIKYILEEISS